ncbi:MAG: hypothetical protein KGN79_12915 [Acidobacteriota bacterium]|nr:hypothetical protein [Acidobacteriota bacterium]
MQVSVEVTAEIRGEAEARGLPIVDYIELLIERGRQALQGNETVSSALERIRALRSSDGAMRR